MGKFQINKNELLKEKCLQFLGGKKCKQCNVDYLPIRCYDFHHKFGNKDFEISKYKKFDNKMKKELKKCIILCANCHRLTHAYGRVM